MEEGWESITWNTEKIPNGVPVLNDGVYNRVINVLSSTSHLYKEVYPTLCIGIWKYKILPNIRRCT